MKEINLKIEKSWGNVLKSFLESGNMKSIKDTLIEEVKKGHTLYPTMENVFKAFELTPFDEVKVVILGQDPYHGEGQAHGLCFSVPEGIKPPPSLKNIFKELKNDLGVDIPDSGCLTGWAKQGVLLLNAILTVRASQAASHRKIGWEKFTDDLIKTISKEKEGIVFILWGNYARSKKNLIDESKHYIIESAHPSPLSAHNGFFGSQPFSKTNEYLKSQGKKPIEWGKFE